MSKDSKIVTKNFPTSRISYNDGVNSSRDNVHCADSTNDDISEEIISEEDELEHSYTSDENVNDSKDWAKNTARTSVHNYVPSNKLKIRVKENKEKATDAKCNYSSFFKNGVIQMLLVFAVVLVSLYMVSNNTENSSITLDMLREKFPTKIKVITNIGHVINDTLQIDPAHPAVFLLLYTENDKIINNFTNNLALYAAKLLQADSNYIEIYKNELQSKEILDDYGILIDKYRTKLQDKRVMIVRDLQDIPANVAQVFHTFCDEITPFVDRAVYLLTLKVKSLNGKEETIAEAALNENWNELDVDILGPLVTRITSTVLKIEN